MFKSPLRYSFLCSCLFCASYPVHAQTPLESQLPILEISARADRIPDDRKIVATMRLVYNGEGAVNVEGAVTRDYTGSVAIERRGSSSQSLFPKIGYALELRESDGTTDRDAALLGMPEEEDWVLHGPYSDKTLLRNAFSYTLAGAIMPYAPRSRFVELVLGEEYLGVYLLTERIKRDKNRVDISKLKPGDTDGDQLTGGYIIKVDKSTGENFNFPTNWKNERVDLDYATAQTEFYYHYPKPADIVSEQRGYIRSVTRDFEARLAGPDFADPDRGYAAVIDVGSFVDFMLVNEITRNVDGYRLSTYLFKDRDSEGGRLRMGPVWDFNLALANADYCKGADTLGWAYEFNLVCPDDIFQAPFWWQRFMEDPGFRDALATRYTALRQNGPLSDASLIQRLDSLQDELSGGPAERNFRRWPVIGERVWPNAYVETSYDDAVDFLRTWLPRRMAWLDAAIGSRTTSVAPPPQRSPLAITLSPNPGYDRVRLEGLADFLEPGLRFRWLDVTGAVLREQQLSSSRDAISTPGGSGLYFWTAESAGRIVARGRWVRQ